MPGRHAFVNRLEVLPVGCPRLAAKSDLSLVNRLSSEKSDADTAPHSFTAGGWQSNWGSTIFSSYDLSIVYQDYSYPSLAQANQTW